MTFPGLQPGCWLLPPPPPTPSRPRGTQRCMGRVAAQAGGHDMAPQGRLLRPGVCLDAEGQAGWRWTVPAVILNHGFPRDSYTARSQQRQPRPQELHCRILPKPREEITPVLYKLRNAEGKRHLPIRHKAGTTPTPKPKTKPQTSTPHACTCEVSASPAQKCSQGNATRPECKAAPLDGSGPPFNTQN